MNKVYCLKAMSIKTERDGIGIMVNLSNIYPKAYLIFMVPYMPPQAADICIRDGVGYLDFSSNCRLAFEQVYTERTESRLFLERYRKTGTDTVKMPMRG